MDYMKELHALCETIKDEITEDNEKIRSAGDKLSAGDLDTLDKLTHILKSLKGTMAMMEEDDEYSSRYPYTGGSYTDGSYRRGRGSYAQRRDSMGRYSREQSYSRDGGMVEELKELMHEAPDERTRQEFQRFIQKIENISQGA